MAGPKEDTGKETGPDDTAQPTELEIMISGIADKIENRLVASLSKVIDGINARIDQNAEVVVDFQAKSKTAFEVLPHLIQEHVEKQLRANLEGMVKREWKARRKE